MFEVVEVNGEATEASSSDREIPLWALFKAWDREKSLFTTVLVIRHIYAGSQSCRLLTHMQITQKNDQYLLHSHWHRHHTSQQCSWNKNGGWKFYIGQKRWLFLITRSSTDEHQAPKQIWTQVADKRETHSMLCKTSTSSVFWSGAMRANTVALSTSCSTPVWTGKELP